MRRKLAGAMDVRDNFVFSFTFPACALGLGLCYEWGHGHFFLREAPFQGNQGGLCHGAKTI